MCGEQKYTQQNSQVKSGKLVKILSFTEKGNNTLTGQSGFNLRWASNVSLTNLCNILMQVHEVNKNLTSKYQQTSLSTQNKS